MFSLKDLAPDSRKPPFYGYQIWDTKSERYFVAEITESRMAEARCREISSKLQVSQKSRYAIRLLEYDAESIIEPEAPELETI